MLSVSAGVREAEAEVAGCPVGLKNLIPRQSRGLLVLIDQPTKHLSALNCSTGPR